MAIGARDEYIIAPRGWGKSEGIDAPRLIRDVFAMPRSTGALLSPTYGKLLRNTLPALFNALSRLGYQRNKHYFVGRKAPKALNFKNPYIDPFDYSYTIHWFTGSIQNLISFDRPMSANSMSLDYIKGFEAKFLDYDKVKNEVLPANRGNLDKFGNCPWHHGQNYSTDMPTSKVGSWIFDKQKEMDTDLIKVIKATYAEIVRLKTHNINPQRLAKLQKELNFLRSKATFYAEYSPFDNLELLGEKFYRDMKRDLPPFIFRTAILNKRIRRIENGFYAALNERVHYYDSFDNHYLEGLDYDLVKAQETDCRKDGDMDANKPLYIALDYNANINWLACGQPNYDAKFMRTLKTFYVKGDKRVYELLKDFHSYYQIRSNRDIIYYFDNTAQTGAYAISTETFSEFVTENLRKLGWNVMPVYMGQAMRHDQKHRYINDALRGLNHLLPLFNRDNNEELLTSMEQTSVKIGPEGFKKNKDGEKKPETPEDQLQYRTDVTDAWDTLWIGCTFYPFETVVGSIPTNNWTSH